MAQNNTKLELTWIGKDSEKSSIEPRILIESPEKSYGTCSTGVLPNGHKWEGNMIIHGDNLLALKALEKDFSNSVRCIYIDPPYNTGSAFEYYDDGLEHSIWLSLMRQRLIILRNLLTSDGSIWIQIDDEEQAYLKVICDEVFGRNNFVNMVSVNMKNIAGASGGGEDKRLKKNVEYILIYAKSYDNLKIFKPAYSYSPIAKLVEDYRQEGKSWKYTTALVNPGVKEYVASTVDGDGNEIRIYKRKDYVIESIGGLMRKEHITEAEAYRKYAKYLFQTAMPQSSIRPRVMEKVKEIGIESDLYSIEYVPKTGRNKGQIYEQFYKGENFRLFAWLRDVAVEIDGEIFKKDLQGTYWDFVGETKNLTKEGQVEFPNGKKSEALVGRIVEMTTEPEDLVLDSFLGSGTTAAVAHKMNRRYIGVELGNHAYTHCLPRLKRVIDGEDHNGITAAQKWNGGGGFKFYELAPSLLKKDIRGNLVINKEYNADMLAAAMAKMEGFTYEPSLDTFWKQGHSSETDYIFTTTRFVTVESLGAILDTMADEESLLICCKAFQPECKSFSSKITVKKIPSVLLGRCEFDHDDYSLNIIEVPLSSDEVAVVADDEGVAEDLIDNELSNEEFKETLF